MAKLRVAAGNLQKQTEPVIILMSNIRIPGNITVIHSFATAPVIPLSAADPLDTHDHSRPHFYDHRRQPTFTQKMQSPKYQCNAKTLRSAHSSEQPHQIFEASPQHLYLRSRQGEMQDHSHQINGNKLSEANIKKFIPGRCKVEKKSSMTQDSREAAVAQFNSHYANIESNRIAQDFESSPFFSNNTRIQMLPKCKVHKTLSMEENQHSALTSVRFEAQLHQKSEKMNMIPNRGKQLLRELNIHKEKRQKKTVFKTPAFLKDKVLALPCKDEPSHRNMQKASRSTPKNFKLIEPFCTPDDFSFLKFMEQKQVTVKRGKYTSSQKRLTSMISGPKLSNKVFGSKIFKPRVELPKVLQMGQEITLSVLSTQDSKTVTLKVLRILADNGGSSTYLVVQKHTAFIYCLKKSEVNLCEQSKQKLPDYQQIPNLIEYMTRESKIGMFADHPFLVKTYCTLYDDKNVYQLMEFAEGSSLQSHNKQQKKQAPRARPAKADEDDTGLHDINHIREIVCQLLEGVRYLHEKGIVHRDLKPANIFLSHGHAFKIGDFGCSIYTPPQDYVGTLDYAAPEIMLHRNHGFPVDMWAIGCIAYELYVGRPPFFHPSHEHTIENIVHCHLDLEKIGNKQLRDFVGGLLQKTPSKRMSASEALQHEFVREHRNRRSHF